MDPRLRGDDIKKCGDDIKKCGDDMAKHGLDGRFLFVLNK